MRVLAATMVLLLLAPCTRAGDMTVNTSAWNYNDDDDLSLLEANLIATGLWSSPASSKHCFKGGEKNRTSGIDWGLANFTTCDRPFYDAIRAGLCVGNPAHADCLWVPDTNDAGASVADVVRFADSVGVIAATTFLLPASNDQFLGRKPNGSRTSISGSGIGGGGTHGIFYIAAGSANIVISGFDLRDGNDSGIYLRGSHAIVIRDCDIHDNARYGIFMEHNDQSATGSPYDNTIGGTPDSDGNLLRNNGIDGLLLVGDVNETGFAHNNKFFENQVYGNGSSGIAIVNSRANLIGDDLDGNNIYDNGTGIYMSGSNARDNEIFGNEIGSITIGLGNDYGVILTGGANHNVVGGAGLRSNGFTGANLHGVRIDGSGTDANSILGNAIGASRLLFVRGNARNGVLIHNGARDNVVADNTIVANGTGADPADGFGVAIDGALTVGNIVRGNLIGHFSNGNPSENRLGGVSLRNGASQNIIGGANLGNAIGPHAGPANDGFGILVDGNVTNSNEILGNRVGLTTADVIRANAYGIVVRNGARFTRIGGNVTGQANVVSGNILDGISVLGDTSDDTDINDNLVGLGADGETPRGNGRNGIYVDAADSGDMLRNTVANNVNDGIKLVNSASFWGIHQNRIGASLSGVAQGNLASGIALISGPNNNNIGGVAINTIVDNQSTGIYLSGAGTVGNQLINNFIGFDGTPVPKGNGGAGIFLGSGAQANTLRGNIMLDNNLGIDFADADGNFVHANLIGGVTSSLTGPNAGGGIRLYGGSANNTFGSANASDANTIVGNGGPGIGLYNAGTENNQINFNRIGYFLGDAPLGNLGVGILIQEGASLNLMRGAGIRHNLTAGVRIRNMGTLTTQNSLLGNSIGDNVGYGVMLDDDATFNQIGSTTPGDGNLFYGNSDDSVAVISGSGNPIRGNQFVSGDGLSIDLGSNGINGNDALDADSGANALQNHPIISDASLGPAGASIVFSLSSRANRSYAIDLHAGGTCPPSGGIGVFRTSMNVSTNASGVFNGALLDPGFGSSSASLLATDLVTQDSSEIGSCRAVLERLFGDGFETAPTLKRFGSAPTIQALRTATDSVRLELSATSEGELLLRPRVPLLIDLDALPAACRIDQGIRCRLSAIASPLVLTLGTSPDSPLQLDTVLQDRPPQTLHVDAAVGATWPR